jgi:hypothetical protein
MHRIRILAEAAEEAMEAAAWYESERQGLGQAFSHAIDHALASPLHITRVDRAFGEIDYSPVSRISNIWP